MNVRASGIPDGGPPYPVPIPPPPPPPGPPARDPVKDARTWGMFCHLAALSGYVGVPLGHIVGPLVVWQIKKNEYPFVDQQGKESLNFQISVLIYEVVCIPLIFVFCIGVPLLMAIGVGSLIFVIMAAVKANSGVPYRYPLTIRFIS